MGVLDNRLDWLDEQVTELYYNVMGNDIQVELRTRRDVPGITVSCTRQADTSDIVGSDLANTKHVGWFELWPDDHGRDAYTDFDVFITDDDDALLYVPEEHRYQDDGEPIGTISVSYRGNILSDDTAVYRDDDAHLMLDVPADNQYTVKPDHRW